MVSECILQNALLIFNATEFNSRLHTHSIVSGLRLVASAIGLKGNLLILAISERILLTWEQVYLSYFPHLSSFHFLSVPHWLHRWSGTSWKTFMFTWIWDRALKWLSTFCKGLSFAVTFMVWDTFLSNPNALQCGSRNPRRCRVILWSGRFPELQWH